MLYFDILDNYIKNQIGQFLNEIDLSSYLTVITNWPISLPTVPYLFQITNSSIIDSHDKVTLSRMFMPPVFSTEIVISLYIPKVISYSLQLGGLFSPLEYRSRTRHLILPSIQGRIKDGNLVVNKASFTTIDHCRQRLLLIAQDYSHHGYCDHIQDHMVLMSQNQTWHARYPDSIEDRLFTLSAMFVTFNLVYMLQTHCKMGWIFQVVDDSPIIYKTG